MTANGRLPAGSEVWAYIRVSSEQQADKGLPVEGQRQAIAGYCQQHGYSLTRTYVDEARSGATDQRAQFQALVSEAPRHKPAAIVIWSWSRFSRDQNDAMFYKASLRRNGVEIVTVEEDIPRVDGFGTILEALVHWKDEQYLRSLSESSRRGQQALVAMGYVPAGGPPPYGYRVDMEERDVNGKRRCLRRWVLDPDTAPIARRAWEMKLQGASDRAIWQTLGIYRHHSTLSGMFSNPAYRGAVMFGGTVLQVPAIVSEEEWERVQSRRRKRLGGAAANRKRSIYRLSGIARCGLCGSTLNGYSVLSKGTVYHYYTCHRHHAKRSCAFGRVRMEALEAAVLDAVFNQIVTVEAVEAHMAELQAEVDKDVPLAEAAVRVLEERLCDLALVVGRLVAAVESGQGSVTLYERLRERELERDRVREQLEEARAQLKPRLLQAAPVQSFRESLRRALDSGDPQVARELLRELLSEVVVEKEALRIRYRLPFGL